MADKWLLEDGSGAWTLEESVDYWILEEQLGAGRTTKNTRTLNLGVELGMKVGMGG